MKRIIAHILCLSMLLGLTFAVKAEGIGFNETIVGVISETQNENKYEFELSDSGNVQIKLSAENMYAMTINICDNAGKNIWKTTTYQDSTSKQISYLENIELVSGKYTLIISRYSSYGTYELSLAYESCSESFKEEQSSNNNTLKSASEINVDESYTGQIAVNDETDIYKFTLENSGKLKFSLNAENMRQLKLKFYDNDGQEIWDRYPSWNETSKRISFSENVELTSGTYYFSVSRYNGNGTYDFSLEYESCGESFKEEQNGSNNSIKSANEINVNESYVGQIAVNDETDIYKFTLKNSGKLKFSLNAENMRQLKLKFYDNDGQEIWDRYPSWNETSKRISFSENVELTSGTYYFSVSRYNGNGTYDFSLEYESCGESFKEEQNGSNNSIKSANEISLNESYMGQIAVNDETDVYKFTLENSGDFDLSLNAEDIEELNLKFYDDNGQEIWKKYESWNSTSKQISFSENVVLAAGTYYFSISKSYGNGTYEFSLNTKKNVSKPNNSDEPIENEDPVPSQPDEPIEDEIIDYVEPNDENDNTTSFGSKVSDWAKEEVEEAYENDLIPDTIIGEDLTEHITRAEFAAIAVQLYEELSGIHPPADQTPFIDVDWNKNVEYINKAYILDIVRGTSNTTFEPNIDITREQLAAMLCRTIKKYSFPNWSLDNDDEYYLDTSGVDKYADDDEISDYAKSSVYYMSKFKIIYGVGDNKFAPKNTTSYEEAIGYATATREQALLMALRIFNVSDIWN